jgi:TPR repeat protein
MNRILSISLILFAWFSSYSQTASELNEESKKFIQTQEFDKAVPLLKKAAELGSAEAQYNLGYCYQAGIGTERDLTKSIEWYSKSAEQGWNDALYAMMMAYGNGQGVNQDSKKAFEYALRCADNNDPTCMFNVIGCYKDGTGTDQNIAKMLAWAIRLGKLENPENLQLSGTITSARLNLANLYRDGSLIEKDLYKSYLWYLIYNESKVDFSYFKQQSIIEEIKELEGQLTEEQLANSKTEAEALLGRELRNLDSLYKAET